jgi:hypothetical protein
VRLSLRDRTLLRFSDDISITAPCVILPSNIHVGRLSQPEHTFLQQLKKVAKKSRSQALLKPFTPLLKKGREYALSARSHSLYIHI